MTTGLYRAAVLGGLVFAAGCEKSTTYWAEQTKAEDPAQRRHAVHVLSDAAKDQKTSVPALIEALKDDNHYVRRDAARALGHVGPEAKDGVPALRALLRDREPSVRRAAGDALQKIDPGTTATAVPAAKVH
ncbi:HEAT repeat domain-containing protein [Fimbriiglobus ruber]|uniref:HEAT repeat protein n=1 Tax=Fimbriiglobus ruber TaxID=1908690 RepID=A0A225D931_9BACT|nr:HEAT repeat domain-containing protein [Fimbriiglobus ruber]OWK38071.1 hypothetical protein FRUB_07191 [Fimbriiglobus ruber]